MLQSWPKMRAANCARKGHLCGADGSPLRRSTAQMPDAETKTPSFLISPRMRRHPQRGFSLSSRRMNIAVCSSTLGRPSIAL